MTDAEQNTGFMSCFQLPRGGDLSALTEVVLAGNAASPACRRVPVVGVLLDEPSSRTRFSVESASYRLGAQCIVADLSRTSLAKGESIGDSARTWARSCDLLCVRSRITGLPHLISMHAGIPVINLGDGRGEHPTQGLATIVHAISRFGGIKGLQVCLWGDVKYSRCAHSVMIACVALGARVVLCARPMGELPLGLMNLLNGDEWLGSVRATDSIEASRCKFDIIYVNRLQEERRSNCDLTAEEYGRIGIADLEHLSPNGCVLHPLPRKEEMDPLVVADPRCLIWEHVNITYMTRQWLIGQYLHEPEARSSAFFIQPFHVPESGSVCCECAAVLGTTDIPGGLLSRANPGVCPWCFQELKDEHGRI